MAHMTLQRVVVLGVIALATAVPFVVVGRQISSGDGTPVPVACEVAPRSLAEILAIGSSDIPNDATPLVAAALGATPANDTARQVGTPAADGGLVQAIERTVMGAAACRESGDALRFLAYFTDTYIREQFAAGALSDETLLRFGETASALSHRVVAIQSVYRTADGQASAIVLITTSPDESERADEGDLLVEEYNFVESHGTWKIDQVRPLANVSASILSVAATSAPPSPSTTDAESPPTVAPTPAPVDLSAPGISWSTNEITIAQGGTINLFNDGSGGPHNFVIEGYNDDTPVDMPAGSEVDWVVPDDIEPGTYTFYCGIPGHRALMEGTITVGTS